jgi:hypothetical protein
VHLQENIIHLCPAISHKTNTRESGEKQGHVANTDYQEKGKASGCAKKKRRAEDVANVQTESPQFETPGFQSDLFVQENAEARGD